MLLRLRSPVGQQRLSVEPSETLQGLLCQIASLLNLPNPQTLSLSVSGSQIPSSSKGSFPLSKLFKHGDLVTVTVAPGALSTAPPSSSLTSIITQAPIDDYMEKQDGMIPVEKPSRLCKHGPQGMCEYCLPLEPYDANYLTQKKIKNMSFHAYLKSLKDKNQSSTATAGPYLLESIDLTVKNPCPSGSHDPYPQGICTKCQPSAVSLQSQSFRMVDHVEFESPGIIDTFLGAWRQTGVQRFGYMYGKYAPYSEVPLGVKAVVAAIYEPAQEGWMDGIQVDIRDAGLSSVDSLAQIFGLERIGMIYTDLIDDGSGQGKVICKRHAESFFLSSAEIVSSSQMQHSFPVKSKYAEKGIFGSRFVTCVLTGNEDGEIDISCFQVSNVGVSMARDGIIEASVDPSLMRVVKSSPTRYVPEVFYKYKNAYGLMVQEAAKPTFPVDYLIVTMTHGFPQSPSPIFTSPKAFPVENRPAFGTVDASSVKSHLDGGNVLALLSDFHLLVFLQHSHFVDQPDFQLLCHLVQSKSDKEYAELVSRPSWQTFFAVLQATSSSSDQSTSRGTSGSSASKSESGGGSWACRHCTFVNTWSDCEMCGLPRD